MGKKGVFVAWEGLWPLVFPGKREEVHCLEMDGISRTEAETGSVEKEVCQLNWKAELVSGLPLPQSPQSCLNSENKQFLTGTYVPTITRRPMTSLSPSLLDFGDFLASLPILKCISWEHASYSFFIF